MFKFTINSESKRGPGYIILNILRVLNIIALLTVVIASWVMLVMTVKTSNFFFFDGVSHFITSTIGLFLIASELPLDFFISYFEKRWPMLGIEKGFVFLGLSMMALGFNILGNLNKEATSEKNLGLPLWRIVIASGILSAIMGFFNLIATYIFCDSARNITGRQVRSHGAAIPKDNGLKPFSLSSGSTRRPPSTELPVYNANNTENPRRSMWNKFSGAMPNIRTSRLNISKPISNDPDQFAKWDSRSSPVLESRSSPVVPDVQRPPTALHPYHAGLQPQPPRPQYPRSSTYSEVSDMTRF